MKSGLKIQSIILLLFLPFFESCRKNDQIKIGVCVVETSKPVYTQMKKAMLENAERLGVEIIWIGVKDGEKRRVNYAPYQEELIYELFAEEIQALIFNPIIDATVYSLVYAAKNRDIPVIALDKLIKDLRFDAYVATNETEMGVQAASYLVEKIEGKGNIIVLEGPLGDKKRRDIVLGFYKVLDQFPEIRIISSPHLSKRDSAFTYLDSMLTKYADNIQGVIACDSTLIAGAVEAINVHGLTELSITVGVGASQDACSLLKPSQPRKSKHDMELYSVHYTRGLLALETAVKLINGEKIEYDAMLLNGEIEVKTLYGPIRQLTWQDYYSRVKDLW